MKRAVIFTNNGLVRTDKTEACCLDDRRDLCAFGTCSRTRSRTWTTRSRPRKPSRYRSIWTACCSSRLSSPSSRSSCSVWWACAAKIWRLSARWSKPACWFETWNRPRRCNKDIFVYSSSVGDVFATLDDLSIMVMDNLSKLPYMFPDDAASEERLKMINIYSLWKTLSSLIKT